MSCQIVTTFQNKPNEITEILLLLLLLKIDYIQMQGSTVHKNSRDSKPFSTNIN